MNFLITSISHALYLSAAMGWGILWPLILGFTLSGIVQAVISHKEIARLMPDDSARSIATACGLGAASSSCSYAATALARSLFRKGADFTAAMAFQLASTNLVLELALITLVLLGWQFMLGEVISAPIMVVVLVFLFRRFLTPRLRHEARVQADRGLSGKMEGHAAMDMSVAGDTSWQRLFSRAGITAMSHYFVMDWASVWIDIVVGLLIAGALAAWVPNSVWQGLFLTHDPVLAKFWGPLIGPLIAMVSFVCSVGNIPLAAVLWNGGISFGGVIAFILADLLIIPILHIYRKYYGWRMMGFLLITFYAAMVVAAFVIEAIFGGFGLVPTTRHAHVILASFSWNYTTWLNIIFLALAGTLVWRFLHTGGPAMLRMMSRPVNEHDQHAHHCAHK